ncbi:MAG TPA: flagellar biosynthesis anti-sigma factor FlgM [Spirochaetota bacterium]|nr:flagellar biosynthesis anti-sigma factor FlgM [Spirochaetota bacterium]
MSIDKIGSVPGYNGYSKTNKLNSNKSIGATDSVDISSEALSAAENKKIFEIVMSAPDVRRDKIEEIREKLKNPNYINETVLKKTSDKIADVFGI